MMTEPEKTEWRKRALDEALAGNDLPTSTHLPPLERWVLPEESGYVLAACLTSQTGPTHVGEPNGSVRYTGGDPQWLKTAAAKKASVECFARFTTDPRTQRPWTPSTMEAIWYYYRDYAIPCLAERGFAPDNPLPSLDEFAADNGVWSLYPGVQDPDHLLTTRDMAICPEPPWKVLLGP